jgi:hypothetical protein
MVIELSIKTLFLELVVFGSVSILRRTPMFEWHVVGYGSKDGNWKAFV